MWIDTKQLSAVVDPIQLNLRMWTGGGGSGVEGSLTWLVGRVESFSCYTTARVFSRPDSGPAALCLFFLLSRAERSLSPCRRDDFVLCPAHQNRDTGCRWMGAKGSPVRL